MQVVHHDVGVKQPLHSNARHLHHGNDMPEAALIARAHAVAARWQLALEPPFGPTPGTPGNFVAPATRPDGTSCVLKVSDYLRDTQTEIAALALWQGNGAARLLAAEPGEGALLLERVEPGNMLAELAAADDDAATRIAADLLRTLWCLATEDYGLQALASWCAAYDRNREALSLGADGFPSELFVRADALRAELLATTRRNVALHGDLHHFNVLRSDRAGWLAIDPKGLVGDPCFDLCQFLLNPDARSAEENRRRLDILCDELGLDRQRASAWCLVHAVLNACWAFEDGKPWRPPVAYAFQTLEY